MPPAARRHFVLFFHNPGFNNRHRLNRHVGIAGLIGRSDRLDFIHHPMAFHHLAEHGIAPTLGSFTLVIQKIIFLYINKKLG